MPTSSKRNKYVLTVRVWKRRSRRRWYCTITLPGRKAITRSCGSSGHRAAAEDYAVLALRDILITRRPAEVVMVDQSELFPAPEILTATPDQPQSPTEHP
jgi:hypothetical protein